MNQEGLAERLFLYLKFEKELLSQLIELSDLQQSALIKFNSKELDRVTRAQEEAAKTLKNTEEQRIRLLMTVFDLTRSQAAKLKLSEISENLGEFDKINALKYKDELSELMYRLTNKNSSNRLLSSRALRGVNELLTVLNDGNSIFNVKI